MNNVIKVIKSFQYLGVLIDADTEIVKDEIKKDGFLGVLLASSTASLVQPVIFSVVKSINGEGVRRAGRRYMNKKC